jgi:lysozyme
MIEGIDVSDYQNVSSFHEVEQSGRQFVYAKATEGIDNVQETFHDYSQRVRLVDGLFLGAYHFMDWNVDPVAQANHFLSVYTPQAGDLPPALDCEAFDETNPYDVTDAISAFLKVVEPHLYGSRMILYTFWDAIQIQSFLTSYFSGHLLWLAEPGVELPDVPQTWKEPTFWQYDAQIVPGIDIATDLDRFLGTSEQLANLTMK